MRVALIRSGICIRKSFDWVRVPLIRSVICFQETVGLGEGSAHAYYLLFGAGPSPRILSMQHSVGTALMGIKLSDREINFWVFLFKFAM